MSFKSNQCQFYGCYRDRKPDATATVSFSDFDITLSICADHEEIFKVTPPEGFQIGFTVTNEVELRSIPVHPNVPQEIDPEPAPEPDDE